MSLCDAAQLIVITSIRINVRNLFHKSSKLHLAGFFIAVIRFSKFLICQVFLLTVTSRYIKKHGPSAYFYLLQLWRICSQCGSITSQSYVPKKMDDSMTVFILKYE